MGGFVHFVINLSKCQRPDTQGCAGRSCWCSWHTCRAKPIQSRWNEPDFRAANWSLLGFLLGILSSANLSSFRWGDLLLWKDLDLQQMPSMNHLQCFLCLKRQYLSSKAAGKVKLKLKWEVLAVFSSQGWIPNLQNIMFHSTLLWKLSTHRHTALSLLTHWMLEECRSGHLFSQKTICAAKKSIQHSFSSSSPSAISIINKTRTHWSLHKMDNNRKLNAKYSWKK